MNSYQQSLLHLFPRGVDEAVVLPWRAPSESWGTALAPAVVST
jgi:hypothetical protein